MGMRLQGWLLAGIAVGMSGAFSSLLVVPVHCGVAEEREEPNCNSLLPFLLCEIRVWTHGVSVSVAPRYWFQEEIKTPVWTVWYLVQGECPMNGSYHQDSPSILCSWKPGLPARLTQHTVVERNLGKWWWRGVLREQGRSEHLEDASALPVLPVCLANTAPSTNCHWQLLWARQPSLGTPSEPVKGLPSGASGANPEQGKRDSFLWVTLSLLLFSLPG